MKRIIFCEAKITDHMNLVNNYIESLTGVVDDFWEEHILKSTFYLIIENDREKGFFTLYQEIWDKNRYITSFYIKDDILQWAREIFQDILSKYEVKKAYAATCDESFLSLCLDFHKEVELQAYFFDGTTPHVTRDAEFGKECMQKIAVEEMPEIRRLTGDFYNDFSDEDMINGVFELYRICYNNETLGVGIMVPNKLKIGYTACGEIVLEQHRRKGVARSLQINMAQICRSRGEIPIGGCWYKNINSLKTFYSCGRYSNTRLLNITF
jgi:hypothetical protein